MKPQSSSAESRRSFIKKSILAGSFVPFMHTDMRSGFSARGTHASPLKVHVFSKHLQFLNYNEMAEAAAGVGFDGVDLTVRPKGHVLPERVEEDLPKAVDAIRKAGLSYEMMTTAVQDANDHTDKKLLETAAKLGIKSYRMNWLSYPENKTIPQAIVQFQETIKDLSLLNKTLGITGAYQNHSGLRAGASIWELWDMVQKADKQYMGVQYDIRHAVVEGGLSWKNGLRLIHPEIKILAIKDFVWMKKKGSYVVEDVPLGQGMVDFKTYFTLLKRYNINVPVSLHHEYPLGGAEHGLPAITVDKKVVFDAMRKDLKWLRDMWERSGE
ncbi:MAG TPA: sugar phosphate isomerase/epimerase family protein [Chryseosolibacter sp.]|jgi:Xylose isomerase-like TIM barrel.